MGHSQHDLVDSSTPHTALAAERTWDVLEIRFNITRLCDNATQVRLLRVNNDAFRLAVQHVWRSRFGVTTTFNTLKKVDNSERHALYVQAVRHIECFRLRDISICMLRFAYPNVRSIDVNRTDNIYRYEWTVDDQGRIDSVLGTLEEKFEDERQWDMCVARAKKDIPQDWPAVYRPSTITFDGPAKVNAWIAAHDKAAGRLRLPIEVDIGVLKPETYELLDAHIRALPRGSQPIVERLSYDQHTDKQVDGNEAGSIWRGNSVRTVWKGIAADISVRRSWEWLAYVETLQDQLISYQAVALRLNPWQGVSTFPWDRYARERLQSIFDPASALMARTDVRLTLVFRAQDHGGFTNPADAFDALKAETVWLRRLAEFLLLLRGPSAWHTVTTIAVYGWNDKPRVATERLSDMAEAWTFELNALIADMAARYRKVQPPSWRQLKDGDAGDAGAIAALDAGEDLEPFAEVNAHGYKVLGVNPCYCGCGGEPVQPIETEKGAGSSTTGIAASAMVEDTPAVQTAEAETQTPAEASTAESRESTGLAPGIQGDSLNAALANGEADAQAASWTESHMDKDIKTHPSDHSSAPANIDVEPAGPDVCARGGASISKRVQDEVAEHGREIRAGWPCFLDGRLLKLERSE